MNKLNPWKASRGGPTSSCRPTRRYGPAAQTVCIAFPLSLACACACARVRVWSTQVGLTKFQLASLLSGTVQHVARCSSRMFILLSVAGYVARFGAARFPRCPASAKLCAQRLPGTEPFVCSVAACLATSGGKLTSSPVVAETMKLSRPGLRLQILDQLFDECIFLAAERYGEVCMECTWLARGCFSHRCCCCCCCRCLGCCCCGGGGAGFVPLAASERR